MGLLQKMIMTREEKIQDLRNDFLKRNGKNFTSRNEKMSIGWENRLVQGEAYSQMITDIRDETTLHKQAYQHAKDMVTAMNIPQKIKISISGNGSYTDGKTINVATDMLDDKNLTVGQKLDIFTGLAIHECCHILHTDFNVRTYNRLRHDLTNIIEDERIEMLLGQEKPGLANFLGATKYHYFGKHERETNPNASRITRLFNAILSTIRFPLALSEEDINEFADELSEARNILQPYPTSTTESLKAAERIEEILFKSQKKENEKGNGTKQPGQTQKGENDKKELSNALSSAMDSIERNCMGQIEQNNPNEINNAKKSKLVKEENGRKAKAIEGSIEIGKTEKVNLHFPEGNKDEYLKSLARIKANIPAMTTALRNNGTDRIREIRGLRNGKLDTNKLAEAMLGVETIYTRKEVSSANRMAVCILVDESGSMDGEKIQAAKDTVILLNEAMKNIPNIDLFIYGHTTEQSNYVKLNSYIEPGRKNDKYALGSIEAQWSNIDSKAILEAAARVRAKTNEHCLFIVISDGEPCEPETNVRTAVKKLSKDGFSVISVGIDFDYNPETMYDNHVNMTNMSKLAPDLGKMIKKTVLKSTERR